MKRVIYIMAFTVLGIMLQMIVHVGIESWYIRLLVGNFERYNLGLSWSDWYIVHHALTAALLLAGTVFGYVQGVHWWNQVHVNGFRRKLYSITNNQ